MKLIFAGTSDARSYALSLADGGEKVIVCTATAYGASLYSSHENIVKVYGHPMQPEEMETLLRRHAVDMIVDATHPYAVNVSDNIRKVSEKTGIPVKTLDRKSDLSETILEHCVVVPGYTEACRILGATQGNILLTIGSNHIETFGTQQLLPRLIARVLPTTKAIEKCIGLGISPRQIIAMQGPFSVEMNTAIYYDYAIKHIVTKDSGKPGGVIEKVKPALAAGIQVILIERPDSSIGRINHE